MKKKKNNYFFVFYNLFCSSLIVIIFVLFVNQWNDTYSTVDGLTTNYKDIVVNISSKCNAMDLVGDINSKGFAFRIQRQNNKGYTPIYSKNITLALNLVEGREFDCDDYEQHRNVAIISTEYLNNVYIENGEKYISVDGDLYEVVGVFEKEKNLVNDNTNIFINMLSDNYLFSNEEVNGRYLVDSNVKMDDLIIMENPVGQNKTVFELSTRERINLVLDTVFISYKILVLGIVFVVVSWLLSFIMWLVSGKKKNMIHYICGGTEGKILKKMYFSWMGMSIPGKIATLVIPLLLMKNRHYYWLFVCWAIIYAIISFVMIDIAIKKQLRRE